MAKKFLSPKVVGGKLNSQQEMFCQLYASDEEFFAHGTNSYMKAYGLLPDQKKVAEAAAARLLGSVKICQRINEILEDGGLNDQFVDKQLQFLITQHKDLTNKNVAIKEYNKLKARITDKVDHTSMGQKISLTALFGNKSE